MGPGFDSQVPHFFHNVFLNMFLYSMPSKVHHTTPPPSLPRAQKLQSEGHQRGSPCTSVNLSTCIRQKVKKGLFQWAKLLYNTPLNWVSHPHGLHIFVLYFNFPFILLFVLLFYLIHKNNFHNTKIRNQKNKICLFNI